MPNFLITSTYFSSPRSSSHVSHTDTHIHWIPGLPCNRMAVLPWRCCGQSSRTARWNSAHLFPFSLTLPLSSLPSPLPRPGWSGLLLLTALHKCLKRSKRERERWKAQMQRKTRAKILQRKEKKKLTHVYITQIILCKSLIMWLCKTGIKWLGDHLNRTLLVPLPTKSTHTNHTRPFHH